MTSLTKLASRPFIGIRTRLARRHLEDEIKILEVLDDDEDMWTNIIRDQIGLSRGRMHAALARLRVAGWLSVDWDGTPPTKYRRTLRKLVAKEFKR